MSFISYMGCMVCGGLYIRVCTRNLSIWILHRDDEVYALWRILYTGVYTEYIQEHVLTRHPV
jgi:hypothetical protein